MFLKKYRFDNVFSFSPQYYLMHVTKPSLKRIFTEKVMYCTLSNTYRAFIERCSIVASICITRTGDMLTGKLCRIFHAQWVLANQNRERCSFTWEKNDTCNQKATEVCEFRAIISSFFRRFNLQLAAPSLCELLRRHLTNKDLLRP